MIEFRDARLPLVQVEIRENFTAEDWSVFRNTIQGYFDDRRTFALSANVLDIPLPDVSLLKTVAVWMKEKDANYRAFAVAVGLTIQSPVVRGALGFVQRIAPPPFEQKVFNDHAENEAWVLERLKAAGLGS